VSEPGPEYYEAVPYVIAVETVLRNGQWLRRAEHPELPGCAVEAPSAVEAIEQLDEVRRQVIRTLWERGAEIPVPRPPLRRV
jgi:predicted RNase H-like HicB family nuclease